MEQYFWHNLSGEAVLDKVASSFEGISSEEASRRIGKDDSNHFHQKSVQGWANVLARQFASPLIIVLIIAGLVSFALGEWVDASVIAIVVAFNTLVGFVQEYKANRSLEKLRSLSQPKCIVRRDGVITEINATQVVAGDIVILRLGDRVCADARLLEASELFIDESTLTGESSAILKTTEELTRETPLADRRNMIFAGTNVVGGRGVAVVIATARATELWKIAALVAQTKEERTPLQLQLLRLARTMSVLVLLLVAMLFLVGIVVGRAPLEMLSVSVALCVAAIPEGLAVSVTIILAIGMRRILRRKSLVRTLVGAETLGSVSIICTDKTGTITQGEMCVTDIVTIENELAAQPFVNRDSRVVELILRSIALCNDAVFDNGVVRGNPTERAMLTHLLETGINQPLLSQECARTAEIPFDSARKYMTVACSGTAGHEMIIKGAYSAIAPFLISVALETGNIQIASDELKKIESLESALTDRGLRVIAIARKLLSAPATEIIADDMNGFEFLGFVCLRDPLREKVKEQIKNAAQAGVRTVMITGDHPHTALAIGREAGIAIDGDSVVTGVDLDSWSDEEFARRVSGISVFARVEPRHKIRIVRALQALGEVVAMTGDGVNDAPALKAADIGIALGSGTDVAKQSSDIVVLDNNFGIITSAIEEGRIIFDNIRKTTVYLLSDSFTEIVLIGGSIMFGLPIPLLPAQILWINLVEDSFPNIGLTLEPGERDVMSRKPRSRKEPVLNREMSTLVFIIGIVTDLILFALYFWLLKSGEDIQSIRSIMFAAVSIDSLFYIFAVKSLRKTIFRTNPFSNRWLLVGVAAGFVLIATAFCVPPLRDILEISTLSLSDFALLLMIGLVKLVAIEIMKEIILLRARRVEKQIA